MCSNSGPARKLFPLSVAYIGSAGGSYDTGSLLRIKLISSAAVGRRPVCFLE